MSCPLEGPGLDPIDHNLFVSKFRKRLVPNDFKLQVFSLIFLFVVRWTVYGITSFGEGCGNQGKYGIYAKVPNYSQWIEETIDKEEAGRPASS